MGKVQSLCIDAVISHDPQCRMKYNTVSRVTSGFTEFNCNLEERITSWNVFISSSRCSGFQMAVAWDIRLVE
jgi:hypothetical protein